MIKCYCLENISATIPVHIEIIKAYLGGPSPQTVAEWRI